MTNDTHEVALNEENEAAEYGMMSGRGLKVRGRSELEKVETQCPPIAPTGPLSPHLALCLSANWNLPHCAATAPTRLWLAVTQLLTLGNTSKHTNLPYEGQKALVSDSLFLRL